MAWEDGAGEAGEWTWHAASEPPPAPDPLREVAEGGAGGAADSDWAQELDHESGAWFWLQLSTGVTSWDAPAAASHSGDFFASHPEQAESGGSGGGSSWQG